MALTCNNHSTAHTSLVRSIRLAAGALPDVVLWPVLPGGVADASGRPIRCGPVGMSDLIGIVQGGRWIAIEVKTGRGTLTPDQERWQALIRKMGGVAVVARSVDDAMRAIEEARR